MMCEFSWYIFIVSMSLMNSEAKISRHRLSTYVTSHKLDIKLLSLSLFLILFIEYLTRSMNNSSIHLIKKYQFSFIY